jgi:PAS domain S-box-containing protein
MRAAEEHYRSLFEAMAEGFASCRMIYDEAGAPVDLEYLEVNEAFGRLTGLHDVEGRLVSEVIPGHLDTDPGLFEAYGRVASTGVPEEFDVDVKALELQLHLSVYRPQPGHFVVLFTDITERKRAEAELEESQRFVAQILDTSPNLIYIYDLDEHRNVYANQEVTHFLGYTAEQILEFGSALFERVLHPDDAGPVVQHHGRLAEAPDGASLEIEYRMKDSAERWRWLRSRDTPFMRGEDGRVKQILGFTEEITERKQAEDALRDSEEKFRYLFDHSIVGKSITSPTGEIEVNDAFCEMLGYTRTELSNKATWAQLTHPDDIAETQRHIDSLLAGENASARFEKRFLHKDGSVVWADVSSSLRRDAEGGPLYFMTALIDITERRRAAEELRQTHAILQGAMDQSPVGIAIADAPDGRLRYVNDAGLLIRGGDRQSIVDGVGIEQYVASWQMLDLGGAALEPEEVPLARAIMFGERNGREFIIRRTDGEDRIVLANAAPITDDAGRVVAGIAVFTDITDRKQAEDALRTSQLLLMSSIECQKDTILFAIDRDHRYLVFNKAHEDVMKFAYGQDIKVGDCILDRITSDDDRVAAKDNYDRALGGESHTNIRVYGDVNLAYYESFFNPIVDEQGVIIGATGLARDITERMTAEEEIRRLNEQLEDRVRERTEELHASNEVLTETNAQLEEATRAKSDFLASMSHELRTPLNSIIGFSGVLLQGMTGSLDEEQRKQVVMINNSGRHLLELINEILDLARIESGRSEPVMSEVDVAEIAREMLDSIRPMAGAKGIEVRWSCPEGMRPVRTDGLRVGQILLNLMGNAVRFTKEGHVGASLARDDSGTTVTVEDSGCGIAATDLARIFEDFYQVPPHGSARSGGTGLGLAVSRRLADSIGATIEVASEPGRGSVFTLRVPDLTP